MPTFTGSSTDALLIAEHCLEHGLGARTLTEVLAGLAPDLQPNPPGSDDLHAHGSGDWLKLETTLVYERPGEHALLWRSTLKQRSSNGLLSGELLFKFWLGGVRHWQLARKITEHPKAAQRLPWRLEAFKTKSELDDERALLRRVPVVAEQHGDALTAACAIYSAASDGSIWFGIELDPAHALDVIHSSTQLFATHP